MGLSQLLTGKKVTVKSGSKLLPAVLVGELPDVRLVWVRIDGRHVTLIDARDVVRDRFSGLVESKFTFPTG